MTPYNDSFVGRYFALLTIFISFFVVYPCQTSADTLQARSTLPFSRIDKIENKLLYFDKIAGSYPPNINTSDELSKIKNEWHETENELIERLIKDPESYGNELMIAHLYRYGHNLDIKDSFSNSESHFKKSIYISPNSVDAHIGLAVLYVNYDFSYMQKAEQLFKKAIEMSDKKHIPPEAFLGLFFANWFQGRPDEAMSVADKYIEQNPNDSDMRRLREMAQARLDKDKEKNK